MLLEFTHLIFTTINIHLPQITHILLQNTHSLQISHRSRNGT